MKLLWANIYIMSFVSTLETCDKAEILHRLYLVLHLFWTIACIMSWFFAIETHHLDDIFLFLWYLCLLFVSLVILIFWAFICIVSHLFASVTFLLGNILLARVGTFLLLLGSLQS